MKTRIAKWIMPPMGVALFVALTVQGFGAVSDTTLRSYVHKMLDAGGSCSAVMIAPGRAMTAKHCTDMPAPKLIVNGREYVVTEAYSRSDADIAVLIVPGAPCPCAPMGARPVQQDEPVTAVGYPFGAIQVLVSGPVQGRALIEGQEYIISTVRVAPGMSGGGVFNFKGELVGIISATDSYGYLSAIVEIFTQKGTTK